ncbi:MAG: response regulator, partial [Candidatus Hydrothermae bacterium]|nr:response regulator [Candidatus Hydrothermae bacterium]
MPHVLILDDNASIRDVLQLFFEEEGFEVHAFDHPLPALQFLEEHTVDLVLLDLRLPEMDGLAVLRKIHAWYPELPVVVITAYATLESAIEALRLGAMDYLRKPFELDELRAVWVRVRYQMFQLDSPRVLSTLFDVLEEGVLVLDREGYIRLHSPSLSRMFDLQEDLTGLRSQEGFQYIPRSYPLPNARLVLCRLTQHSTVVLEHRRTILLDRRQFGEVLSLIAAEDLAETARRMADMLESLREEARLDPLTGLYNRRHLKTRLRETLALHHRYGTPATLVLMDLDHFKDVNDRR